MGQDKPFGATQLAMLALPTDQEEHLDCLLLPHLNYIHFCSDNHWVWCQGSRIMFDYIWYTYEQAIHCKIDQIQSLNQVSLHN